MSGFLHRLAEQAMGRVSPVRSVTALPYAPPPAIVETDGQSGEKALPPGHPAAVINQPVVASGRPQRRQSGAPTPAAIVPAADRIPPKVPPLEVPDGAPARDDRRDREIPRAAKRAVGPHDTGETNEADEAVVTRAPPSVSKEVDVPADIGAPRLAPSDRLPVVEPLLAIQRRPKGDTAKASVPSARRAFRGAAAPGAASETTEVHVSIGRIEVTAVHEAPPPRRQAAPRAKPMTLEQYLAKRRGRPA